MLVPATVCSECNVAVKQDLGQGHLLIQCQHCITDKSGTLCAWCAQAMSRDQRVTLGDLLLAQQY